MAQEKDTDLTGHIDSGNNDQPAGSSSEKAESKGVVLLTRNNGVLSGFIVGSDAEGLYINCFLGDTIFLPYEHIGAMYR